MISTSLIQTGLPWRGSWNTGQHSNTSAVDGPEATLRAPYWFDLIAFWPPVWHEWVPWRLELLPRISGTLNLNWMQVAGVNGCAIQLQLSLTQYKHESDLPNSKSTNNTTHCPWLEARLTLLSASNISISSHITHYCSLNLHLCFFSMLAFQTLNSWSLCTLRAKHIICLLPPTRGLCNFNYWSPPSSNSI